MSRLASIAKAGYFPTPERVTQFIQFHLERPQSGAPNMYRRFIDPCCGYGAAVHSVATAFDAETYGIELDADRAYDPAHGAIMRLTKVLQLDYNAARVSHEAFSVLYLNPPYDVNDDKETKRLEFEFLKDTSDWLAPDGILIYILPQYRLNPRVARWLTSHYAKVRAYRFPDPEYKQFKQIVVFGVKKESITRDEDAEKELLKAVTIEFGVNLLPVLTPAPQREHKYLIPEFAPSPNFVFRNSVVQPEEAVEEAAKNGAHKGKMWRMWTEPQAESEFSPLMPLKKGHLAMLIASGMMQNLVLEKEDARLLVKGRTYKTVDESVSEDGNEERQKDRFVTEIIATDLSTGETRTLNDPTSLSAFIDEWQAIITKKVMESYDPLYKFDYAEHAPIFNTLSRHRRLPGRSETGLFDAQKHVASAFHELFQESKSGILVGEMGVGKTTISSAVAALLGKKANPALVMCPPHLTKKWCREIQEIIPNSFAMELRHIRDVDEFFRQIGMLAKGTQCFAVLSREMAKLGSGWKPAYVKRRVVSRDPFEPETVNASTILVCPKCSTPIEDEEGALVTNLEYFDRKRHCQAILKKKDKLGNEMLYACNERLWQQEHLSGNVANLTPIKTRYPIAEYIARQFKGRFQLFIGDECFPAGTQIATLNGSVPIEHICVGDKVISYANGKLTARTVIRTIRKPLSQQLVRVCHTAGIVLCTPNHKFFTKFGYIRASDLNPHTQLTHLEIENDNFLPDMRESFCPYPNAPTSSFENLQHPVRSKASLSGRTRDQKATQGATGKTMRFMWERIYPQGQQESFLQPNLCHEMELGEPATNAHDRSKKQIRAATPSLLRTNEKEKSKLRSPNSTKDQGENERTWISATGWQWSRTDCTPIHVTRLDRIRDGISDSDGESEMDCGNDGFGKSRTENRYRSGWEFPQPAETKDARQDQGKNADRIGLGCSAFQEQGDHQSDQCGSPNHSGYGTATVISVEPIHTPAEWVYDLEVEDTHCYFANEILVSNCHEAKGQSTDQGYAFGALSRTCKHTLALTGTLYGGYASSLFFILHRMFPKFRKMYGWGETQDFVARYGVLERVTKYTEGDDGYGKYSGRKRSKTYVRELPGISPELAMLLLDATAFLSIKDLGFQLPPFDEQPDILDMDEEQRTEYNSFDNAVKMELQMRMAQGDFSLMSAYLQSTLGYPNSCFREEVVTDKQGREVATAPAIHHGSMFPKEHWLLDQVKENRKEGRRVLVFCRQTGTRDITTHLVELLGKHRIKAIVLPSSVNSNKREEWVARRVKEGYQVLITNPNLVKTGLDLIAFPSILFYELDYSIYTMMQAARRSWRLGQTEAVRVRYAVYAGTMEHRAMALVASKWQASEMLIGDSVQGALAQEADSGGSFLQELAKSVIRNAPVQDLQALFRERARITEDKYIGFEPVAMQHAPEWDSTPIPPPSVLVPAPIRARQLDHGMQLALF